MLSVNIKNYYMIQKIGIKPIKQKDIQWIDFYKLNKAKCKYI